jgi:hypothetical protein
MHVLTWHVKFVFDGFSVRFLVYLSGSDKGGMNNNPNLPVRSPTP